MTVLKKGSSGKDVTQLQELLGINQDGIFGPNTEAALKTFQRDNGLTKDGQVIVGGGKTWLKLKKANSAISTGNALNAASATNVDGALTFDALIKPFKKAYNYIFGGPLEIHNKKPRKYPKGTKPPILDKIVDAGHQIFENGPYDLNLFGIRSKNQIPNSFDDWLGCAYQDGNKTWCDEFWKATTDPGISYLGEKEMLNEKGTAILVPGQYKNTYRIAKHKGKYYALCQRGKVKVWRDNNKDNILDWEGEIYTGDNFGINIHRANTDPEDIATKVDWHSAGCQVIANINDFNRMMGLANTQKTENKGDTFTYTLLTEEDIR